MDDLIEKHQLAAKLFEFTSLQDLSDEQDERHSPVFRGQNKILVALSESDNISQKELAERLNMSTQSTAEFITKLVKKGLVVKNPSPKDGRVQLIQLTDKGRREAEKSIFYIPEYINYLDADEREQLAHLLDKMNAGIREHLNLDGIQNLGTRVMLNHLDRKTEPSDDTKA
ncbi:MarR family transcriptional regulator [Weissella viridescens]|uniref:MarR family transcriptional regulator n=1 Tax=Weissella viridescens TaxID=1629 RepID=A0A3P2RLM1_WEIVI|nr:MarR family winged helix-turn-helix transcriptional regulator [Weissella viridescens]RRG18572.1 MarR family transcriptional regulator [Weissella viridescens]